MQCLLCSGNATFLLKARDWRRPNDQTLYQLYWCNRCEFGRLAGDFSPAQVQEFYDSPDYYTHDTTGRTFPLQTFAQRLRSHLAWRLDFGSPLRIEDWAPNSRSICEIGCGDGGNLRRLKDAGFDVLGIEPDPRAREIASRTCSVLEGTAENLPPQLNEQLFDAVLMIHSLEHCIDPVHAARNVMSLLKPGGIAIIEVPNCNSLGMRSYGVPGAWCDIPRHLNFFTEKSLTSLLLKARLQKLSAAYDGYMRQFSPGWTASQYAMWKVSKDPQPPPNFDRRAYWLFLRTALAKQEHKYDSVRITARAL